MTEFFQTIMGNRFYGNDVPTIAKALQEIAKQLKIANELKEKEIEIEGAKND